jgi:hypothetical protein
MIPGNKNTESSGGATRSHVTVLVMVATEARAKVVGQDFGLVVRRRRIVSRGVVNDFS